MSLQLVNCTTSQQQQEQPVTYDQFLQLYAKKEHERQGHFSRKRKWSAAPDTSCQSVRVCATAKNFVLGLFIKCKLCVMHTPQPSTAHFLTKDATKLACHDRRCKIPCDVLGISPECAITSPFLHFITRSSAICRESAHLTWLYCTVQMAFQQETVQAWITSLTEKQHTQVQWCRLSNQYKMPSSTRSKGSIAVDSLRPVFNTFIRGELLNTGPRNLASRN